MAKNASRKDAPVMDATTDSAVELAVHISAILNHPATPVNVCNALADAVQDLYVPQGYHHTVEYLTVHLANHIRKGKRKLMERKIDNRQDAEFLAAVLQHDETPEEIRNYIADVVLEMVGNVNICTPEVLRVAWPLIMAQYEHTDATIMQPLFVAIRALARDEATEALLWKLGSKGQGEVKEKTAAPSDLAQLISTVLRHPETPSSVRESILQGMCQYSYDDTAPEHIRLVLDGQKGARKSKRG